MYIALLLTVLAGLATLIGGALGILTQKPSNKLLALSLGFAAGIMLFISFVEILPAALDSVSPLLGYSAFCIGLVFYFFLDRLLPHYHAHDFVQHSASSNDDHSQLKLKMKRTAILLTLGISLHNFPEGIATFVASNTQLELGIAIALAIGIHNIPEGLAVAVPIYLATGSKWQAIFWSGISGAFEILGGVLAFFFFAHISIESVAMIMAAVAGIMVALAIDELIPLTSEIAPDNNPSVGILSGIVVMGLSLMILEYV